MQSSILSFALDLLHRFGAFAFFPLGLLDMSSFLAPGSFDRCLIVLTVAPTRAVVVLRAHGHRRFGLGARDQLSGWDDAAARKRLEKRLGARRSKMIYSTFQRWGFWSLFVVALARHPRPPPRSS